MNYEQHIKLSAITQEIRCDLCQTTLNLSAFLRDDLTEQLGREIKSFTNSHERCTRTVSIVLDKLELWQLSEHKISPEKFVVDTVRNAIKALRESK